MFFVNHDMISEGFEIVFCDCEVSSERCRSRNQLSLCTFVVPVTIRWVGSKLIIRRL